MVLKKLGFVLNIILNTYTYLLKTEYFYIVLDLFSLCFLEVCIKFY